MVQQPETKLQSPPMRLVSSSLRAFWAFLNSGLFIAILSSIAVAVLTQCYAASQSRDAELSTRRTELSQLIVELDLRVARLGVISKQASQPKDFTVAQLSDIGHRAKAIVAGDSQTVTSDPAFHNFHMVTLLSRAETAAGLSLTNKQYLLSFTDYTDMVALHNSTMLYERLYPLVSYLEKHLASGDLPAVSSDPEKQAYQSDIYAAYNNIYAAKYPD
jgi:hypothetical protein